MDEHPAPCGVLASTATGIPSVPCGRLLLQPHGFEGLVAGLIDRKADDLPLAKRPDGGTPTLNLDAARSSPLLNAPNQDDRIVGGREKLDGVEPAITERVVAGAHKCPPRGMARVDAAIRRIRVRPVERGLRMDVRESALDVSVGEAPHDAPHDLHVLLQHRRPSIPQRHADVDRDVITVAVIPIVLLEAYLAPLIATVVWRERPQGDLPSAYSVRPSALRASSSCR
jgi:hypothetical protein